MSDDFRRQLRWELRKLWRRPRTYVGFVAAFLFELLLLALLRVPVVRAQMQHGMWRFHERFGGADAFSAASIAVEVTSQTLIFIGSIALALVASDLIAKEVEDGTLRMTFCRPVTRDSVLLQKVIACALYTAALAVFIGTSALLLAHLFESPGRLVVLSARESIAGIHDLLPGLVRYALAVALLPASIFTVALLALTLGCLPIKPATATTAAILVLLADWSIQAHPTLAPISPYTLMTRMSSWRQVFADPVPWPRLERNYADLLWIDAALLLVAWWALRRRSLMPR